MMMAVGVAGAAETAPAPASPVPSQPFAARELVAKGKGLEITRAEVDEAFALLKANAASSGGVISEDRRDAFLARVLDRMISTKLLVAQSTPMDKAKAAGAADRFIADMKKKQGSEEMFRVQLKALGLTPEKFREGVLEQAICDEVIDREVRSKYTVGAAELRQYYDEHPAKYAIPEQVKLAHIFFSIKDPADKAKVPMERKEIPAPQKELKRKLAESVLARARKGEDYGRLAREFTEDTETREKGGEFVLARGQMKIVPAFEASAFTLGVGQISDLVTTAFGYHILKCLEKIPAGQVSYEAAAPGIRRELQETRVQAAMPAYLQKLRQEASVEILAPALIVTPEPTKPTKAP
jgi:parvulin-like peptidyl-prolyl isomerase